MNVIKIVVLILGVSILSQNLTGQVAGRKQEVFVEKSKISRHGPIRVKWYKEGWFVEANIGARLLGATTSSVNLSPGINTNLSLGYYFTKKFAVKGRYDFNSFKFTPGMDNQGNSVGRMHSASLEVMTDLVPFFQKTKFHDWRIVLHGGAGLSTYGNIDYREFREEEIGSWEDPAIKGNDDMGHIILGVTPQYHISGRVSINLDISTFLLIKQSKTFDQFSKEKFNGLGNVSTISLGLTFRP